MSKPKQKRANYNEEILKALQNKYDVTAQYIRMSIRGERTGTMSIKIQEDYKTLEKEANKAVNNKIKDL